MAELEEHGLERKLYREQGPAKVEENLTGLQVTLPETQESEPTVGPISIVGPIKVEVYEEGEFIRRVPGGILVERENGPNAVVTGIGGYGFKEGDIIKYKRTLLMPYIARGEFVKRVKKR